MYTSISDHTIQTHVPKQQDLINKDASLAVCQGQIEINNYGHSIHWILGQMV